MYNSQSFSYGASIFCWKGQKFVSRATAVWKPNSQKFDPTTVKTLYIVMQQSIQQMLNC